MKSFKRSTLLRIVFSVGFVLILLSVYYYNSESEEIDIEKQEYLKAVNSLKIDQIVQWRKERLSTAKFFPTIGKFIKATADLIENRYTPESKKYLDNSLRPFRLNHYYENVFITDATGSLLYSLDSTYLNIEESSKLNIKEALQNDSVLFTDFYFHQNDKTIYFDLISPIKGNNGNIIGSIIQRAKPEYSIFQLISKWPSESKSAESLLFKKKNNSVIFLSELRHKRNAKLSFTISLNDTDVIAVKGAHGKEGTLYGKDYRGEPVLADLRNIPDTDWYIISKIDRSEIYENILFRIELLIILIAVLLVALVLGYLYSYKSMQSKEFQSLFLKEKELSEVQKEFKTTLYSIGDAVITTDNTGKIKYMNGVAEELTGWTEVDAKGIQLEIVFNIINEATRLKVENPAQKVIKNGVVVSLANHTLLISRAGKEIPIADSGSPIKDEDGKIIGVVLVFRDQNAEREKEKQLLENIQKYKLIFNSAFDAIVFTQLKTGKLIEINDSFTKMFGYERDEAIGKLTTEIEIWADVFDRERFVQKLNSTGVVRDVETIGKRKDGSLFTVIISANTIVINDDIFIYSTIRDITEKKKVEQAVQMFKFVSDLAPMSIFWLNEQAGFDYVNEEACNSLGYSREELMKLNLFDIDPVYPKEAWVRRWNNSQGKKITTELIESTHMRKNGSRFPIEVVVQQYWFNNTNLHVAFVQDITKRKNAEVELRFNEERYKKLFDHSPVGILLEDEEGIIQVVNDAHCKITGYSKEDLVGKSIKMLSTPDKYELIDQNIKEILSGKVLDHAAETIRKDGSKIVVQLTETKIVINNDRYGILCISNDITEIVETQSELKKLSRAVEQSPATIMITDIHGQIEYVNPKFEEVTGYSFDEVRDKNPRFLSSGNIKKSEYAVLWNTILSGKEWRGEFFNRKKNGELFWESATISPIISKNGTITNFISIKEDITSQKKLTEELIKAKEKAEEMNRIKSYFYANMSHELRTPFVGILGYSELLSELLTDSDHREMANQILTSSRRLTDTLNKVLNITKLEFDRINPVLEHVNLFTLMQELKLLFAAAAKQKNINFQIEYNYDNQAITTDENLLREILTNLINNAVKFTSNGSIKISAQAHTDASGDFIIVMVADTGLGIPKEKQQIIWDEFRQASEGLNRSFEGTGLGLTITKKYCEILGGQISLESEVGRGSVFSVKLPVQKKINIKSEVTDKKFIPGNNRQLAETNNKPLILYIEDDIVAQEFVKLILTRTDCTVDVISEAGVALKLVKEKTFDIILIDINLGYGMDGVEVMQQIRQHTAYEKIPIVAVTAYASESDKEEFLAKGFSHYLSKPFTIDELKSTIKSAFSFSNNHLGQN